MSKGYTVYDTDRREYLEIMNLPLGDPRQMATKWTRRREEAYRFQSRRAALEIVNRLGNYSEFVVKNEKGEIVG